MGKTSGTTACLQSSHSGIKGTILENYSFDVRDFTESQLNTLENASLVRTGNKELRTRLLSSLRSQKLLKEKYFKRVGQARSEAYAKHLRYKNATNYHVPGTVVAVYETFFEAVKGCLKSLIPSKVSIYSKDSMHWPEIVVDAGDFEKPHLIAGMPPDCIELTGLERLKQAFFPEIYKKYYDPKNPTHTFNSDVLLYGTVGSALTAGCVQAYGHAKMDLDTFKKDRGSHIYESRTDVFRARQQAWIQSFAKYGLRWGWRVGFLFASVFLVSQSLTIYKLEDKMSHYIIGAALPTALYKWKLGPIGMFKTGLIGSLLIGVPVGFFCANMGMNPKSRYYYSRVESRVVGPLTDESMRPEEYFRSHKRMLAILNILNTEHCDELNNPSFYREFLGEVE